MKLQRAEEKMYNKNTTKESVIHKWKAQYDRSIIGKQIGKKIKMAEDAYARYVIEKPRKEEHIALARQAKGEEFAKSVANAIFVISLKQVITDATWENTIPEIYAMVFVSLPGAKFERKLKKEGKIYRHKSALCKLGYVFISNKYSTMPTDIILKLSLQYAKEYGFQGALIYIDIEDDEELQLEKIVNRNKKIIRVKDPDPGVSGFEINGNFRDRRKFNQMGKSSSKKSVQNENKDAVPIYYNERHLYYCPLTDYGKQFIDLHPILTPHSKGKK